MKYRRFAVAVCWVEKKITEMRLRRVPSKQQTQQTPPRRRSAVFSVCVAVGGGGGEVVLDNLSVVSKEYSDVEVAILGSFTWLNCQIRLSGYNYRSKVKRRVELLE